MSENEQQTVFSIEKIYLKDLSLEVPNAPQIFLERDTPQIDVQLNTHGGAIGDGIYQSMLTVTVTAKLKDSTMFLVEASQAGIFRIANVPADELDPVLGIACPNILFPYIREVISEVVVRAGFPPVLLNPMNFETLYQQQKAEKQEPAASAPVTH
jgi:preprotein translocase subunit SecB